MTKNRTPTPVYLDPGMHSGLEVKGLMYVVCQHPSRDETFMTYHQAISYLLFFIDDLKKNIIRMIDDLYYILRHKNRLNVLILIVGSVDVVKC